MYLNRKTLRTVFFIAVLVAVTGFNAHSQTMGDVLERVRAIKFFEMDRIDVKQVLYEMTFDGTYDNRDDFTYGDFDIEVYYATGECDEDDDEIFEAEAGKVVRISISSSKDFKIEQIGFDLSKLKKEQVYLENESEYFFHDKKLGIAVKIDSDDIEFVALFPGVNTDAKTCSSEIAREFVKYESWFGSKKLEDRIRTETYCAPPSVVSIMLDRELITALTPRRINIHTQGSDPDIGLEKYIYNVTAGRIIGTGRDVVWDLTGVPPGQYSITAGVDDGCGLCGATVTKTVTIK